MGKVIEFRPRKKGDPNLNKLLDIADKIDQIVIQHLQAGDVDPRDLAGVLAHRLGALMRHFDQKSELWSVCEAVVKKQAAIE